MISILNGASELAILAMGMTLVTAASGGQDISVGAAAAIAGSVFMRVLRSDPNYAANYHAGFFCKLYCGNAVWRIQRNTGCSIQYTTDDCNTDPVYMRPLHRLLDQRRRNTNCFQPADQCYRRLYSRNPHPHPNFHCHSVWNTVCSPFQSLPISNYTQKRLV